MEVKVKVQKIMKHNIVHMKNHSTKRVIINTNRESVRQFRIEKW